MLPIATTTFYGNQKQPLTYWEGLRVFKNLLGVMKSQRDLTIQGRYYRP